MLRVLFIVLAVGIGAATGHFGPMLLRGQLINEKNASDRISISVYELQERCGRKAAEVFAKEFNNAVLDIIYQSHYNSKLNKCFYFVKSENNMLRIASWRLVDINENKEYAKYTGVDGNLDSCDVQGKTCRTKEELVKLIKPFMED